MPSMTVEVLYTHTVLLLLRLLTIFSHAAYRKWLYTVIVSYWTKVITTTTPPV